MITEKQFLEAFEIVKKYINQIHPPIEGEKFNKVPFIKKDD